MSYEPEYKTEVQARLPIKVIYITNNPKPPPCFSDADTLMVNPTLETIKVYEYSREIHRLVDIPATKKLTPKNLQTLLRRTLMLIAIYDHSCSDHVKIMETIPMIMDCKLQLSIAVRLGDIHHDIDQPDSPLFSSDTLKSYNCCFNAYSSDGALDVIRMLIEACTLVSPVPTDFEDIRYVLHNASDCSISIGTGLDLQSAVKSAMISLYDVSSVTKALSNIIGDNSISLEEWGKSIPIIESSLSPEAVLIPTLHYKERNNGLCKCVIIATEH